MPLSLTDLERLAGLLSHPEAEIRAQGSELLRAFPRALLWPHLRDVRGTWLAALSWPPPRSIRCDVSLADRPPSSVGPGNRPESASTPTPSSPGTR